MGKRVLAALLLMVAAGTAQADDILDGLPEDVRAFVERADECLHWAGEEPYDQARRAEIAKAVDELRCLELKADFIALKAAYPDQPDLMEALAETFDLQ